MLPVYLTEHNNMIVNNVLPYTVTAKDTFKLLPPEIDTIAPLTGSSGTMVYISGKYLRSVVNLASVNSGRLNLQQVVIPM